MTRANEIQHGGTHYKGSKYQHWDLIADCRIGYLEGCASKYAFRWKKKGGVEDLKKAIHYIDKLIESYHQYAYRATGFASKSQLNLFFEENHVSNVNEIQAITLLCTWRTVAELEQAKHHVILLLLSLGHEFNPED